MLPCYPKILFKVEATLPIMYALPSISINLGPITDSVSRCLCRTLTRQIDQEPSLFISLSHTGLWSHQLRSNFFHTSKEQTAEPLEHGCLGGQRSQFLFPEG